MTQFFARFDCPGLVAAAGRFFVAGALPEPFPRTFATAARCSLDKAAKPCKASAFSGEPAIAATSLRKGAAFSKRQSWRVGASPLAPPVEKATESSPALIGLPEYLHLLRLSWATLSANRDRKLLGAW
eukprot:CAMPEP_0197677342 /NCGR_PEP_ID=MMETSP1338-20131121/88241_1 /TAXON_ID=43686 ORGANISM="Pelagodinium beii, Strain RCC1491" /NCGR_SAMPLE_ID=MMETSP1338 /ASSEMBLY_ACC=CAM_ASM_000754 /LENGTH=127 /DNA_ID=CAMNT_0043258151 /DNA_START=85 /DNA_END=468 /DNA_ORIENTATION=+